MSYWYPPEITAASTVVKGLYLPGQRLTETPFMYHDKRAVPREISTTSSIQLNLKAFPMSKTQMKNKVPNHLISGE